VLQLQPFEGSRDADVAHGEDEFETPALAGCTVYIYIYERSFVITTRFNWIIAC